MTKQPSTSTTSTSDDVVLYQGERWSVEIESTCPVVGEPCEGLRYYGPGTLAFRLMSAPGWLPIRVGLEPDGGNGVYLCLDHDAPHDGIMMSNRWLIARGFRDENGRVTDAGRAALYAAPRF